MADDNSWKTSNFRQSVVNKINEAIQQTGMTSSKNGIEMENHVFHKARNKDEYLGFVARLILHVREMNTKHKNQQNAAAAAQQAQQEAGGNANQQGGGMPDPINALQNLASQGTRPQMMGQMGPGGPMGGQMGPGNASNLLHSLRPPMQMGGMGGAGMQGNRVGMGPVPGGQMGGMMGSNQMQGPGGPVAGMVGGMPGQMGVGIGPGGMSGAKIVGMGQQQQQQQMSQLNAMQMQQAQQQQGGMVQQQQQQQQQQGVMNQGQGGPVQMSVGPGGPNQMNSMVMGQIQAQLQNQNAMGGQQMGPVVGGGAGGGGGGGINPVNQMGPMVGGNSGMNAQAMGMGPNQILRQQQQQQQGMPQGVNANQVQMGLGSGQMGQLGPGVQGGVGHGGPGPNMGQVQQQQQQVVVQQQQQAQQVVQQQHQQHQQHQQLQQHLQQHPQQQQQQLHQQQLQQQQQQQHPPQLQQQLQQHQQHQHQQLQQQQHHQQQQQHQQQHQQHVGHTQQHVQQQQQHQQQHQQQMAQQHGQHAQLHQQQALMNAMVQGGGGGGGGPVGQLGGPIGGPGGVPLQQAMQQQQQGGMGPNAVGGPNQMNPSVAMGPGGVGGGGVGGVMGPVPGQMMGGAGGGGQQGNFVGMGGNPMVRKPPDMMPGGNVYPGGAAGVRSVTPNNFLRLSPSPSVPSPVGPGAHGPPSHPGQMIPSPALIPSPNPHLGSVPQRSNIGQSPGASLNTPGQPGGAVPSPLNPQDEQLYREKYRSLTKYIEPLKRMIAKMENDDIDKIAKMKRLLEILSNPSVRIPLETLHKCEAALTSQLGSIRETPTNNPLVEALSSTLQSANGNHTVQRTFRPCLEALYGPDIKNLPPPAKQPRLPTADELAGGGGTVGSAGAGTAGAAAGATTAAAGGGSTGTTGSSSTTGGGGGGAAATNEIPHILQVEIARLDQKFKVSLDQCAISGTKTIKLMIKLDDMNLPCVPPVAVTIPEDYPYTAPSCSLIEQDYNGTPFLVLVQKSFMARICKLPGFFTLSHLLDTWEMSVRQACSPNPTIVTPTATSVLLGM